MYPGYDDNLRARAFTTNSKRAFTCDEIRKRYLFHANVEVNAIVNACVLFTKSDTPCLR